MLKVLITDKASEYLDRLQRRLTRPVQLLERIRTRLQARAQEHWVEIESLPFASPPGPRRGGFAVRTGALRQSILNGFRIADRAVVAGTPLFYAGYVDALVRRKGIPDGLFPDPSTVDLEREVTGGVLGES